MTEKDLSSPRKTSAMASGGDESDKQSRTVKAVVVVSIIEKKLYREFYG